MPARKDYRDKSWWLGASPYEESPPLSGDLEVDVAVVGRGLKMGSDRCIKHYIYK